MDKLDFKLTDNNWNVLLPDEQTFQKVAEIDKDITKRSMEQIRAWLHINPRRFIQRLTAAIILGLEDSINVYKKCYIDEGLDPADLRKVLQIVLEHVDAIQLPDMAKASQDNKPDLNDFILVMEEADEGDQFMILGKTKLSGIRIQKISKKLNLWDFVDVPAVGRIYPSSEIAQVANVNNDGKNNNLVQHYLPEIREWLEEIFVIDRAFIPPLVYYENYYHKNDKIERTKYLDGTPTYYWTSTPALINPNKTEWIAADTLGRFVEAHVRDLHGVNVAFRPISVINATAIAKV